MMDLLLPPKRVAGIAASRYTRLTRGIMYYRFDCVGNISKKKK